MTKHNPARPPLIVELRDTMGRCPGKWARKRFAPSLQFVYPGGDGVVSIVEVVHTQGGRVVDRAPCGPHVLTGEPDNNAVFLARTA